MRDGIGRQDLYNFDELAAVLTWTAVAMRRRASVQVLNMMNQVEN